MEIVTQGLIHYVSEEILISSRGSHLFVSGDAGRHWKPWCQLPVGPSRRLAGSNRWLSRITRQSVRQVVRASPELFVCFGFGRVFQISYPDVQVTLLGRIEGSHPLGVAADESAIWYGVYTRENGRRSLPIYRYSFNEKGWEIQKSLSGIRHIHGVYKDPLRSGIWVTTGDRNDESQILYIDAEDELSIKAFGSQLTRAVDLLFTEHSLYYGTDAPNESNFIVRLDRESGATIPVQAVGGPVFWGRKEGQWLFFSTVVEPSKVNRQDSVEVWGSPDEGQTWRLITEFVKDAAPMKLFRYGQVLFPEGPGDGEYLWMSPLSTSNDHQIVRISLGDLTK